MEVFQGKKTREIYHCQLMNITVVLKLTDTGRPVLLENELELYSQHAINLYDGEEKTPNRNGRCVLTTHRLFWMNETKKLALPLNVISSLSRESGFLSRSGKLRLDLTSKKFLKLSFKDGGRDEFYAPLQSALQKKAWLQKQSVLTDRRLEETRGFSTSQAGIAGIIRRQEMEKKITSSLASEAFKDLENLMKKAKDVVAIIERYSLNAKITTKTDEDDMNEMILDMGISNPVTKENAGAAYHRELARQLADFLSRPLNDNGGILSLTDVYSMFNRARGVELISPDDLIQAAALQEKLRLGMHMRCFPGGLKVIQSDDHNEDRIIQRLAEIFDHEEYIDASRLAFQWKISVPLALEYLKLAEQKGQVCRDDAFEGVSFYPNRFNEFLKLYS